MFSFSLWLASCGVIFIDEWIVLLYWSTNKSSRSTNFLVLLAVTDLNSKKTVNIQVGLSFTYQIQLKTKQILFAHYKMKNLLKEIVNNTERKRSISIVISDNKTRFKTWLKSPIQLGEKKDYEIALINLETYYSFQNIDKSINCFSY